MKWLVTHLSLVARVTLPAVPPAGLGIPTLAGPAPGPRPRLFSIVNYLLLDRTLTHRPGEEQPLPRPLP